MTDVPTNIKHLKEAYRRLARAAQEGTGCRLSIAQVKAIMGAYEQIDTSDVRKVDRGVAAQRGDRPAKKAD